MWFLLVNDAALLYPISHIFEIKKWAVRVLANGSLKAKSKLQSSAVREWWFD